MREQWGATKNNYDEHQSSFWRCFSSLVDGFKAAVAPMRFIKKRNPIFE
jgi:hypothetical protein